MPISYEMDRESAIVRVTAIGDITLEEERKCFEEILSEPEHCPGCSILLDNRERGEPASTEHVKGMAQAFHDHQDDVGYARLAILVAKEVSFGLGRMFSTLTEHLPLEASVFRDIDEAETWLRSGGTDHE